MPELNCGGAFFSADLAIAFVSLAFLFFLVSGARISALDAKIAESKNLSLQETAFFVSDAMVKNRDENNALFGMARFDHETRRVESNVLQESLEGVSFSQPRGSIFVKSVSLAYLDGNSEKLFSGAGDDAKNCIATERLVVKGGRKALLKAVFCVE